MLKLRQNRATSSPSPLTPAANRNAKADALLQSILAAPHGLGLADLLVLHPQWARRSAQRVLNSWLAQGLIAAQGQGCARRYGAGPSEGRGALMGLAGPDGAVGERFLRGLALSADGRDVLAYVDQPLE